MTRIFEISPEKITFQLVDGLRFDITATDVSQTIEGHTEKLVAAQRSGPVWALQRHLRQRIVLHSAALLPPGSSQAVCIAAPSRTGKSTTSAALRQKGWRFVSDDLASIKDGIVEAGPPHIRLWPDAQEWAGLPREDFALLLDDYEKLLGSETPVVDEAPVGAIVFLQRGEELALEALGATEAMMSIIAQTYVYQNYRRLTDDWPPEPWHFQAASQLARDVECLRLTVPEGLDFVAQAAELLQTHFSK